MAARQVIIPGAMPSRDANGRPLPATFRFYEPDTALTTLATVYTSSALTVAHDADLLSDASGRWPQIWADDAETFDVGWYVTATGALVKAYTDVSPSEDAVLASVSLADAAADVAEAAALVAVNAAIGTNTITTSSTTLSLATGSKVFTLDQTGADYAIGMEVAAAQTTNPVNRMVGTVTAFVDPVLTVNVSAFTGSGSPTQWTISQTPSGGGVTSVAGLSGAVATASLRSAISLDLVDNTAVLGKHALPVPAVAMVSRTTSGAAPTTSETTTNKIMLRSLAFDPATIEYAQFAIRMPKSWNEGTVTFVPEWSHGATTVNFKVSWGLQAVAVSDGDLLDAAFGTAQYSNDTGGVTDTAYAGPESAAITIAGTPAAQDLVFFQVLRKADDATNDTLAVDARLHGITLFYSTDAGNDA